MSEDTKIEIFHHQKEGRHRGVAEEMATGTLHRPENTKYDRQWSEAEVDEFEEVKFPWTSDHPPHFIIHLRENDLEGAPIHLDLEIEMVDGYPENVPPKIAVAKTKGLTPGQIDFLAKTIRKKTAALTGSELVFELIDDVKSWLSLVAKKKVSFYDEMVKRREQDERQEILTDKIAKLRLDEEEMAQRKKAIDDLNAKVQKEIEARNAFSSSKEEISNSAELPEFHLSDRSELFFKVQDASKLRVWLKNVNKPRLWKYGEIYDAFADDGTEYSLLVTKFSGSFYQTAHGKRKLESLFRKISFKDESLSIQPGVSSIIGLDLSHYRNVSVLLCLIENLKGNSLDVIINQVGSFNAAKTVEYTRFILEGLGYLHSKGKIHGDVDLHNIFISPDGCSAQLAFTELSRLIHDLHEIHPVTTPSSAQPDLQAIRAPESLLNLGSELGRKIDIWMLGMVIIYMLFGKFYLKQNFDIEDLIQSDYIPAELKSFLAKVLAKDPNKRPIVSRLLDDPLFSTDLTGKMILACNIIQKGKGISFQAVSQSNNVKSRYLTDFEEISFLGKGAFGAVIKVRNRIDNRFYAVKRIKLNSRNQQENQKILREVTTLSRLHHDRIIRYYQAWIEGPEEGENTRSSFSPESNCTESFASSDSSSDATNDNTDWLGYNAHQDSMMSNSSLLDLAINHTGFSDAEPPRMATKLSREVSLASETTDSFSCEIFESESNHVGENISGPFLYIQMEYCPNQTLRDFIDDGLLIESEIMRLFRQILEGLAYIHSQGLIHRDLKPSNIFLDSNGDIKIGDFGLAVADTKPDEGEVKPSMSVRSSLMMTGPAGTPFYMSPELEIANSRYSSKVDIYSAGIIFVELCCGSFRTTMERFEILRAARRADIHLPIIFSSAGFEKQAIIAKNLLLHDPKQRLSAVELLKRTDLIPPKLEDETIKDTIRSLIVPGNDHYRTLIQALLSRKEESHKDFAFDIQPLSIQDASMLKRISKVKDTLRTIFVTHGAVEFTPPLLLPYSELIQNHFDELVPLNNHSIPFKKVCQIDSTGTVVFLPTELTTPFARMIARNRVVDMKRFSFAETYRPNASGGQPTRVEEVAFDILNHSQCSEGELIVNDARAIKVVFDSVSANVSRTLQSHILVHLNSTKLSTLVLKACNADQAQIYAIMEILSRTESMSWNKRRNFLASTVGISSAIVESLSKFQKTFTLKTIKTVLKQETGVSALFAELDRIFEILSYFGVKQENILIDPLFCLSPSKYSGIMFKISIQTDRKASQLVAYGGRYDTLISKYSYPRLSQTAAVGFQLNLANLAKISDIYGNDHILDVIVISSGNDSMAEEKMALTSELWGASIKADYIFSSNPPQEHLQKIIKKLGITWIITLKEHTSKGLFGTVRFKDAETKQDMEVVRTEIVEVVKKLISQKMETEKSTQIIPHESSSFVANTVVHAPVKVHIFSGISGKNKPSQKAQISERAMKAFTPIFEAFSASKLIEILAHDLPKGLARVIFEVTGESDEVFRRALDGFPGEREVALKFREHVRALRDRGDILVPLFNYKLNTVEIIPLNR